MATRIFQFLIIFILWLLLTWSLAPQEVIVGAVVSLFLSLILHQVFLQGTGKLAQPARYFWFLVYLPVFFYHVVRANLDVAYRVLHPEMPIRPGIVKVRTTLESDMGRAFLANSITLTPGTLTVDLVGDHLYIHWINIVTEDPQEETEVIVKKFEHYLRRVFE
ncbi:Na+/H+ antiporter subunit E [Candidatus Zixiibacteriota bacterium]